MNKYKVQKCAICGKMYKGYGNNAFPIDLGRCCNECNDKFVIPLRVMMIRNPDKALKILFKSHNKIINNLKL